MGGVGNLLQELFNSMYFPAKTAVLCTSYLDNYTITSYNISTSSLRIHNGLIYNLSRFSHFFFMVNIMQYGRESHLSSLLCMVVRLPMFKPTQGTLNYGRVSNYLTSFIRSNVHTECEL